MNRNQSILILMPLPLLLFGGFLFAETTGRALPLDLAYTMKGFGREDNPELSNDGKWLVYGVYTPPEKSATSELESEPRFLPNGTPGIVVGSKLFLTELASGKTTGVCPEKGNCWRPSWSPDSSKFVFYSDADGIPQVWIYELTRAKSRKVSEAPVKTKLWTGDEAYWSPDGTRIYLPLRLREQSLEPKKETIATKESGIRIYYSGKEVKSKEDKKPEDPGTTFFLSENHAIMASIALDSGNVKEIVPTTVDPPASCLTISPSGKWLVYLSVYYFDDSAIAPDGYYDLAAVSTSGGSVRVIAKRLEVHPMEYFTLAYRWHPEKDQLIYYKGKKAWLYDFDNPSSESKQLAPSLGDVTTTPILFTADGKSAVLGTRPFDPMDYYGPRAKTIAFVPLDGSAVTKVDLDDSMELSGVLAVKNNILWQREPADLTAFMINRATGERSILRFHGPSKEKSVLWKGFGRFGVIGGNVQQNTVIGTFENVAIPENIYEFSNDFQSKKRLSDVDPRVVGFEFGAMELYQTEVPNYEGKIVKVSTAVVLPQGTKKGDRLPTIVFHYAGSNLSKSADRFGAGSPASIPLSIFVTRGYAALLTDLPIGPEGIGRNPLQDIVDVVLPQVYRASELGYIDINRVGLIGQSYGGYETAGIITRTNLFRAAVAIAGLYDLPGTYGGIGLDGTFFMNSYYETGQGRMGAHPWGDLKRYIDNSPYYQADKIQTPLMIVHGGNDYTCPVVDAERMFSAMNRLGKTAELAIYDKEGHTVEDWSLDKAIDVTKRILTFLETYLISSN